MAMLKTANISFHQIEPNIKKSRGTFVFDEKTSSYYLDFFGMYSSLALGYNHLAFQDDAFKQEIVKVSGTKVANCEMRTRELVDFIECFSNFAVPAEFTGIHFSCTGALAVESAIKAALFHVSSKKEENHRVPVSFSKGFHGITSYGNFITDRVGGVRRRLEGFPTTGWPKVSSVKELQKYIQNGTEEVGCVIIEPIQCTSGDIPFSLEQLNDIRKVTKENNIPLIFDEIQTGFCSTGDVWFFERLGWSPDLVVFGKKSQVSGFFIREGFDEIFSTNEAGRLCVTFDGDILDMIRCKHIIKAIKRENLLLNVKHRGNQLIEGLKQIRGILNPRGAGVLIGFDLKDRTTRDRFIANLREKRMICNLAGKNSIRLRPPLSVSEDEIDMALNLIEEALNVN